MQKKSGKGDAAARADAVCGFQFTAAAALQWCAAEVCLAMFAARGFGVDGFGAMRAAARFLHGCGDFNIRCARPDQRDNPAQHRPTQQDVKHANCQLAVVVTIDRYPAGMKYTTTSKSKSTQPIYNFRQAARLPHQRQATLCRALWQYFGLQGIGRFRFRNAKDGILPTLIQFTEQAGQPLHSQILLLAIATR